MRDAKLWILGTLTAPSTYNPVTTTCSSGGDSLSDNTNGNVIDMTPYFTSGQGYALGSGGEVWWHLIVIAAAANATLLEYMLVTDGTTTLATDGTATELAATGLRPIADYGVGAHYQMVVPPYASKVAVGSGLPTATQPERYLGVIARCTGTDETTATVISWLDNCCQSNVTPTSVSGMKF